MISVVIPALNEEKFLPECLESLKNQDYQGDYEIIVVDNGSVDNTSKVASKCGAKVFSCSKRGVAYARQTGAYKASGDIIVQADADTTYPRNWLKRIANHFSSHPESVALAGAYVYKDPLRWSKFEYFMRHLTNIAGRLFLGKAVLVSGANFAFRREAFLKVNGYEANSLFPDQWGISRRLSRVGSISYDKTLLVTTSARRIQKPLCFILIGMVLNSARMSSHFIKHVANLFKRFAMKLPLLRTPARLATSVSLAIIVTVLSYGYIFPGSQVFGKVYSISKTSDKVVALTFDDGPNEPYTSQVLDILNSYGVKATFFTIGKNVELYPETARRIIAEGNVLGNHTYSHNANHALISGGSKDIQLAQEVIFKVTGVTPHLYRPPHGKKSPWELQFLKQERLVEVTWSVSANDQHILAYLGRPSPETFAKEIISKMKPGKIVLLHDGYGLTHGDIKSDKSLTVEALPMIIEELQHQGYKFVTIPELLGIPAYN
ncbi:MAG: glycosyltransferase [Chloroflexi bacterium]|nr:glycosyltransferase [Chloroflexota bacterium]